MSEDLTEKQQEQGESNLSKTPIDVPVDEDLAPDANEPGDDTVPEELADQKTEDNAVKADNVDQEG